MDEREAGLRTRDFLRAGKARARRVVRHQGRVQEADGGVAVVKIERMSACAHCASSSLCGIGEKSEFTIDVPYSGFELRRGEEVVVLTEESSSLRAVILTYALPSVLLIASLVAATRASLPETAVGALALSVLLLYYASLFILRKRIGRAVGFTIEKVLGEQ